MELYTINQGNDQKYQWANIFFCKQNSKILYSCKKLNPRSALFIKKSIYPVAQFDNKKYEDDTKYKIEGNSSLQAQSEANNYDTINYPDLIKGVWGYRYRCIP